MHIVKYAKENAAAYAAEHLIFLFHFFKAQNPRLKNESGFKSRAAYDGAHTVYDHFCLDLMIRHRVLLILCP